MTLSPLMQAVFAAIPPEEWSDGPGSFFPSSCVRRDVEFHGGMSLDILAASPIAVAGHARTAASDARCAALWAEPGWHTRGLRGPLASRHGFVSVKSAEEALQKWRKRLKKRQAA